MLVSDIRAAEWGDAVEAIERCYELGCTGGLPVVPPTVERVEEALSFSGRHAGEVLGWIPERRREITVEKVAANAVNMESRRGAKCSTSDGSTGDPMHYKTSESTSTSYRQVIHDGDGEITRTLFFGDVLKLLVSFEIWELAAWVGEGGHTHKGESALRVLR